MNKAERLAERRALLAKAEATIKMWQETTAALKAEILAETEVKAGQTWFWPGHGETFIVFVAGTKAWVRQALGESLIRVDDIQRYWHLKKDVFE